MVVVFSLLEGGSKRFFYRLRCYAAERKGFCVFFSVAAWDSPFDGLIRAIERPKSQIQQPAAQIFFGNITHKPFGSGVRGCFCISKWQGTLRHCSGRLVSGGTFMHGAPLGAFDSRVH